MHGNLYNNYKKKLTNYKIRINNKIFYKYNQKNKIKYINNKMKLLFLKLNIQKNKIENYKIILSKTKLHSK